MNGPLVLVCVAAITGFLVIAHLIYERDRDERRDLESVEAWEQMKRDLAPRSIP